ncbi:MAG: hypothetical protein ABI137_16085 [Antricoccus sp.]
MRLLPRVEAYLGDGRLSAVNRAGNLLVLGTMVHGTTEQVEALREDAAGAGIPLVTNRPDAVLDDRDAEHYAGLIAENTANFGWEPGQVVSNDALRALRERIEVEGASQLVDVLAYASLDSRHSVERAAAGAVLAPIDRTEEQRARSVLLSVAESGDGLAQQIALTALGQEAPPLLAPPSVPVGLRPTKETSIAIHGTWARLAEQRWYAPGSELHDLILGSCTPTLYDQPDYFRWTGGYSDFERDEGSRDLLAWWHGHVPSQVDTVYAHSHGGNVALGAAGPLAAAMGLLVLLHTPITPRDDHEWEQIRSSCPRVLTFRSRCDLVMLADGRRTGSTLDPSTRLLPHRRVLPHWKGRDGWFSHSLFIRPRTWRRWDIANEVRYEARTKR